MGIAGVVCNEVSTVVSLACLACLIVTSTPRKVVDAEMMHTGDRLNSSEDATDASTGR
jgi:hypothetical protein